MLVFFCLIIWWNRRLQISRRDLHCWQMFPLWPIIQSTPQSLKQHMRWGPEPSKNLVSCHLNTQTRNFATVQSFSVYCVIQAVKLSSLPLPSLLKGSAFCCCCQFSSSALSISCWWIRTSFDEDLPSTFNCIVLNWFHPKHFKLDNSFCI